MFRQDLFRSGRWHTKGSEFRLIDGPDMSIVGDYSAIVTWQMSEVCTGQVEWGLTSAYGNTTTEEPITSGLDTHEQTLSPLTPSTTYHYRTKSTDADGNTIYSSDRSFATIGEPLPTGGIGPQYGPSTWPERTETSWPSLPGMYTLVPAAVYNASDQAAALSTWLSSTTDVPNGTTVVFDRTELGAGTTYYLPNAIRIANAGVIRSNITLWAYNTTFIRTTPRSTLDTGPIMTFWAGGWDGLTIQGGEWDGGVTDLPAYKHNHSDKMMGISVRCSWHDLTIKDAYIHDTGSDFIDIPAISRTNPNNEWATQGTPLDLDIGHNYMTRSGRQGIRQATGTHVMIHHNVIEDTFYTPWNAEDEKDDLHQHVDTELSDNVIRRYGWALGDESAGERNFNPSVFNFARYTSDPFGPVDDFRILRNRLEGGAMGYGNPDAEIAMNGDDDPLNGLYWLWFFAAYNDPIMKTNIRIEDNVHLLPANQVGSRSDGQDYSGNGNAVVIRNVDGLTISGNDFQGRGVYVRNGSDVTIRDVDGIIDIDGSYST